MEAYIIGSGAILTTGARAGATAATLHAKVDPFLARSARAVAVDFESSCQADLRTLLVVVAGWTMLRFHERVIAPLASGEQASLAQVLAACARGCGQDRIHLFARWLPSGPLCAEIDALGVELVAHSLENIERAALVAGQRFSRFTGSGSTMHRINGIYERIASGGRR